MQHLNMITAKLVKQKRTFVFHTQHSTVPVTGQQYREHIIYIIEYTIYIYICITINPHTSIGTAHSKTTKLNIHVASSTGNLIHKSFYDNNNYLSSAREIQF